ncbi:MAG: hypothetical protein IPL35_12155 [Sphingobacteriales bacterium]|nr:hypothetical protein [Sphingobacteriales bacterium]
MTTQFADTTVGLPTSSNVLLRKQNGDFLLTYRYTFGDDNKLTELACVDKDGNMLWKKQYRKYKNCMSTTLGNKRMVISCMAISMMK